MLRFALTVSLVAPVFAALVACGDSAPTLEELEQSGALTANPASANKGDAGGTCKIPGSTGIPACDQCAQQQCCQLFAACNTDQACLTADKCLSQCDQLASQAYHQGQPGAQVQQAQQQCYNQCTAQNPQGVQRLQAAVQCVPAQCSAYCPKQSAG